MSGGARAALLACLLTAGGAAYATGLQVAPTTLTLAPTQNADGLWLSNIGDDLVRAQVRVYRWTQDAKGDELGASDGLVISPPMAELKPGAAQLIRVIRLGPPPAGSGAVEDAYRLSIDELPIDMAGKPGLRFVLHYSVPIFVAPAGTPGTPSLQWSLVREGDHVVLEVANRGRQHAQLADLAWIDGGGARTPIAPGLLGYVLPNATMRWMLQPPASVFATGHTLEVMINGDKTTQSLSLGHPLH